MKTFKSKTAKEYVDAGVPTKTLNGLEVLSGEYILRENNFGGVYICNRKRDVIASLVADGSTLEKLYLLLDECFNKLDDYDKTKP